MRVSRALALGAVLMVGAPSGAAADEIGLWALWTPCTAGWVASRPLVEPSDAPGAEYYAVELVPTRRVPGTGLARGVGRVAFSGSPFGIAVTPGGDYVLRIDVALEGLRRPPKGVLTAWVSTPELDEVTRIGPLDDQFRAVGEAAWNKFLVFVTLEPADVPDATRWHGPVVVRGMSRSGMMHTLAGHGPFEQELCSKYGYD